MPSATPPSTDCAAVALPFLFFFLFPPSLSLPLLAATLPYFVERRRPRHRQSRLAAAILSSTHPSSSSTFIRLEALLRDEKAATFLTSRRVSSPVLGSPDTGKPSLSPASHQPTEMTSPFPILTTSSSSIPLGIPLLPSLGRFSSHCRRVSHSHHQLCFSTSRRNSCHRLLLRRPWTHASLLSLL